MANRVVDIDNSRKAKHHVLVLAYFFPPFGSAGEAMRIVKFLKEWEDYNLHFSVITVDPDWPPTRVPRTSSTTLLNDAPKNVDVIRVRSRWSLPSQHTLTIGKRRENSQSRRGFKRGGRILYRLLKPCTHLLIPTPEMIWSRPALSAACRLQADHPVDLIYALSPPYSIMPLAQRKKKELKAPLLLDLKDDCVDTPNFDSLPRWVKAVNRRVESNALAVADAVNVVTESSREHFASRYPAIGDRLHYIANGFDGSEFDQLPARDERPRNRRFTIVTAGGYTPPESRDPTPFLAALGRLVGRRPELRSQIEVKFFGGGLHEYFTARMLTELGVAELISEIPPPPRSDLISALGHADLLLLITWAGWPRAVPGRFYEYWAAGRAPILMLDDKGGLRPLFAKHSLGDAVERGDVTNIEASIAKHVDAWARGQPYLIDAGAAQQFDRRSLATQMLQCVFDLIESPRLVASEANAS